MQILDLTVPGFDLTTFEREFEDVRQHFVAAMESGSPDAREKLVDAAAELRRRSRKAAELLDKVVAAMPTEDQSKASRTATFVRGRAAEAGDMLRQLRGKEASA